MEWVVELEGNEFDLNELSKSFEQGNIFIEKKAKKCVLKSIYFDTLIDHCQVEKKAEELIVMIRGALSLTLGSDSSVRISQIIQYNDEGPNRIFQACEEIVDRPRDSLTIQIRDTDGVITEEINQADPIPNWLDLAVQNDRVAKALRLMATEGNSWSGLYKIFEVIESDVGDIGKKHWVTKKAANRFTQTANSAKAIGDVARHGHDKFDPPKNPMTFSEAKSLVHLLLNSWLMSKS